MANTYNPELASRVSAGQSKQFVDYGKSFSEGFTPGLNKAVASKVAKEKAAAEAAKKAAAEDAKQKEEANKQAEKNLEAGLKSFDISNAGYLKSWESGAKNISDSYRLNYVNTIKEETEAGPLDLNQKMQFITDRNDLITKPAKLKQTLLRDTQVLGVIAEDYKDGSFSPVNDPELKEKAAAILKTSKPVGEGLYEYELNGKKEQIDSEGLENLVNNFIYTASADYENLFNEADKIAASTKVTKDGKIGYDFNEGKQLLLKGKIEQRLNNKDTGDDFLFDSLSNSQLKTGPIQDQTYKDKTKSEIINIAKDKFGVTTDEEAIENLKQFVADSYVDLFKNAFPPLQPTAKTDTPAGETKEVKQAKFFLDKLKSGTIFENVTNPGAKIFKDLATEEFESKITQYGLTASPIYGAGKITGYKVYNPTKGFDNYVQDLMFTETLPSIQQKIKIAIGANHPDVFELPVIKQ
jgi:hypothetical protein